LQVCKETKKVLEELEYNGGEDYRSLG